ncbi:MAG: flap endonuclease [Clostridia bacterium]|nr:flap endonuclease [Clostridia bacterium]
MKNRLLVIDGHNLLFQMFYGMPSRIVNRDGISIQGVVGFIGALRKLLRLTAPSHVCIIFDSEGGCGRHELLPEYKANRPDFSLVPEEDNPFVQLPYIYRALDLIGIRHTEARECECDDVIASYAKRTDNDTEVIISSFDSDYFQLISNRVKVIRYRGDSSVILDERAIREKYGVVPSLFADFKALVGDTSDNIKGVRGIGPKTAAKILNEYGPIDEILGAPDTVTDRKLRDKLEEARELLGLNLKLIKLTGECPLPFSLSELVGSRYDIKTMDIIRIIGL